MRILKIITVLLFGAVVWAGQAMAGGQKPFSALAVQVVNGQEVHQERIYVSDTGIRSEFSDHGRDMVRIVLPKQNLMRVLFPQDKVYMEIQAPADVPMSTDTDRKPCPPVEGLTCKKVADAKFGDIPVEQWTQHHAPSNSSSTVWWEPVRKMVVRQEFPDGRIMQMNLVGTVEFEGRTVEDWKVSMADQDAKIIEAQRYIDTDLGIIVKEENPTSGMSRELRALNVMESDDGWFDVPMGYQRIDPPQQQQMPQRR